MTGRATAISVAIAAAAGVFVLGRCSAPSIQPLPPKVAARVDRHRVETVVDSVSLKQLATERDVARRRETLALVARRQAEASAAIAGRAADSLAELASRPTVIYDSVSVINWHNAYDARTRQAEQLQVALDSATAVENQLHRQLAIADSTAAIERRGRIRADSVIAELLPLAQRAGGKCRIAYLLPCPTRKQAAIVGVITGAAAVGVATGKVKIPIRF